MRRRTIINSKNNDIFAETTLGNENFERAWNPIPEPLYAYLSGSEFLVNFKDPNKQLPNVKSVFKSFDHAFTV